jgi:hypothetical protein
VYAFSIGVPRYIKQILTELKKEIDSNTVMDGRGLEYSTFNIVQLVQAEI